MIFEKQLLGITGHLGFGLNRFGMNDKNSFGFTLGISKEVMLTDYHYLPLETYISLWNRNFQIDTTLKYEFLRSFEIEIGHRYFNGAHLLLINLGSSFRLWRYEDNSYKSYFK